MACHYHDAGDMARLKDLANAAPEEFKAWLNLDRIVAREDGKIPRKYRELIADPKRINAILQVGAEKARPIAEATIAEAREKMGLR